MSERTASSTGVGLVGGAGVGLVVGLLGWGGAGLAAGIIAGGAVGLVAGAAADAMRSRSG